MFEKLENYIIKIKSKANKKVLAVMYFFFCGLFIVLSFELGNNFKRQKQQIENAYNQTMYELIVYIENIDLQFSKLKIIEDKSLTITTLSDIWKQTNLAKENLSRLPLVQDKMSSTSKYLTQASDYSYYLIKKLSSGNNISIDERKHLNTLTNYANGLLEVVNNMYKDLSSGRLKWNEVEKITNDNFESSSQNIEMYKVNKTFQDYEGLIYDGAFSEHILSTKPKDLKGEIVTQDKGVNILKEIFDTDNVTYLNEAVIDNLELLEYSFKIENRDVFASITKIGGKLYNCISDENSISRNIDVNKAIKIGLDFMKDKLKIDNMKETYYEIFENEVTINYAYIKDEITYYTDLIKIKVSLDTKKVLSYESKGYTFNHYDRNIAVLNNFNYTKENLVVEKILICMIPTESKNEILAYEVKGKIDNIDCLIYINYNTKKEEKVYILKTTENGVSTI